MPVDFSTFLDNEEAIKKFAASAAVHMEEEQKKLKERIESVTSKLIRKVVNHLKLNRVIDDENILYFPERHPFTEEEYHTIIDWLEDKVPNFRSNPKYNYSEMFETYQLFFEYEGTKFIYRTAVGQGTSRQLFIINNGIEFEEDKKVELVNPEDEAIINKDW